VEKRPLGESATASLTAEKEAMFGIGSQLLDQKKKE